MLQEIYIRLTNSELRFVESGDEFTAKIKFFIVIKDMEARSVVDDAFTLDFYESTEKKAASPIDFQTVIKQYRLPPGQYDLTCTLEDLQSSKVTIMSMVRGRHKTSKVSRVSLIIPAVDNNLIADYIYSLETSPYFNNVNLSSSTRRQGRGNEYFDFALTASYVFPLISQQSTKVQQKGN